MGSMGRVAGSRGRVLLRLLPPCAPLWAPPLGPGALWVGAMVPVWVLPMGAPLVAPKAPAPMGALWAALRAPVRGRADPRAALRGRVLALLLPPLLVLLVLLLLLLLLPLLLL